MGINILQNPDDPRAQDIPPLTTPHRGMGDLYSAALRDFQMNHRSSSRALAFDEALVGSGLEQEFEKRTGESFEQFFPQHPRGAGKVRILNEETFKRFESYRKGRDDLKDLPGYETILEQSKQLAGEASQQKEDIFASSSIANTWIPDLAAGIRGSITDPINLMAMMVSAGTGALMTNLGRTVAIEGMNLVMTEGLTQGLIAQWHEEQGKEYDPVKEGAIGIASAIALMGTVDLSFRGFAKAYDRAAAAKGINASDRLATVQLAEDIHVADLLRVRAEPPPAPSTATRPLRTAKEVVDLGIARRADIPGMVEGLNQDDLRELGWALQMTDSPTAEVVSAQVEDALHAITYSERSVNGRPVLNQEQQGKLAEFERRMAVLEAQNPDPDMQKVEYRRRLDLFARALAEGKLPDFEASDLRSLWRMDLHNASPIIDELAAEGVQSAQAVKLFLDHKPGWRGRKISDEDAAEALRLANQVRSDGPGRPEPVDKTPTDPPSGVETDKVKSGEDPSYTIPNKTTFDRLDDYLAKMADGELLPIDEGDAFAEALGLPPGLVRDHDGLADILDQSKFKAQCFNRG